MNYETYEVRVYDNGDKFWYQNGEYHRVGAPAIESANGYKSWYQNGKLHRVDGPAIEYTNGDKYWWKNGKQHRVDGPAVERADGIKYWYLEGKSYLEKDWLKLTSASCQGQMVEVDGVKYKLEKIDT